jgi:hypothetical protein
MSSATETVEPKERKALDEGTSENDESLISSRQSILYIGFVATLFVLLVRLFTDIAVPYQHCRSES